MPPGFLRAVGILCFIILLAWIVLNAIQQDRTIHTEVEIDAPAERVWRAISTFSDYPFWNPFIKQISGQVQYDARLDVTVQPPGSSSFSFIARVTEAEAYKALAWRGGLVVPGLFTGTHSIRLERLPGDRTRVIHAESFTGLLVGLATSGILDRTEQGFHAMNRALKQLCEKPRTP
jgi:hypothetical protein